MRRPHKNGLKENGISPKWKNESGKLEVLRLLHVLKSGWNLKRPFSDSTTRELCPSHTFSLLEVLMGRSGPSPAHIELDWPIF